MKIAVAYRSIPQSPGWATGDSMVRAFRRLGHEVYPYAKVYQRDEWIGRDVPSDLDFLLRMECGDGETQYPELGELDCVKAYWTFDVARYPAREAKIANQLEPDVVFVANSRFLGTDCNIFIGEKEEWGCRAAHLPYAADPDLFRPDRQLYPDLKTACLIGHGFPERRAFCEAAGVGILSGVYRDQYANALASLKIHVHNHASGGDGLLVMRIWETLASRVCLLTEATSVPPGKDTCVVYRDAADCRRLVAELLEDNKRRERIAANGYNEVMARHTYLHRARTILSEVGL